MKSVPRTFVSKQKPVLRPSQVFKKKTPPVPPVYSQPKPAPQPTLIDRVMTWVEGLFDNLKKHTFTVKLSEPINLEQHLEVTNKIENLDQIERTVKMALEVQSQSEASAKAVLELVGKVEAATSGMSAALTSSSRSYEKAPVEAFVKAVDSLKEELAEMIAEIPDTTEATLKLAEAIAKMPNYSFPEKIALDATSLKKIVAAIPKPVEKEEKAEVVTVGYTIKRNRLGNVRELTETLSDGRVQTFEFDGDEMKVKVIGP